MGDTGQLSKYAGGRADMVPFLPAGARTALDVGCGAGTFAGQLRAVAPQLRLWAVEPDRAGAAAAAASGHFVAVVRGGFPAAAAELPSGLFDCVFFNDVLEHVVEPGLALEATKPLLSDAGVVVASIPNVRCIDVVKPLVLAGEWTYRDFGLLDRTHLRFFTRRSMLQLFDDHGFDVAGVRGMHKGGGRAAHAAGRVLGRRFDEFLFQQYVVVGRPR